MKSLKEQVADLEISNPHDYDPEALDSLAQNEASDSNDDGAETSFDGREHYETVGKSKLRKPDQIDLGKQYSGAAVSRSALNGDFNEDDTLAPIDDDEDSDPFASKGHSESDREDSINGMTAGGGKLDADFDGDEDEEIDSDEAFGESDEERFKVFKFAGSRSRDIEDKKEQEIGEDTDGDEREELVTESDDASDTDLEIGEKNMEDDGSSDDEEDMDDEASSEATGPEALQSVRTAPSGDREKLKSLLANDSATVASSLSAAASADATKGTAVKQQYQTFDRLLDARIKLQRGLSAANDLDRSFLTDEEANETVRRAEEAALQLWSTIESLRYSISNTQQSSTGTSSKKRKAPSPVTTLTSTSELWSRTHSLESLAVPHRRAILNKWSAKTRVAAPNTLRSKLLNPSQIAEQNHITTVLDSYLASESSKLISSSTNTTTTTNNIDASAASLSPSLTYSDTTFYQSLLRDLIASRTATASSSSASAFNSLPSAQMPLTKLHPSGSRAKKVDTKASKGRKVRYTVHEKLQNFTAAEGEGARRWTEAATREFFTGLLGGGAGVLVENGDLDDHEGEGRASGMIGEGDGDAREEEALRLFRS